MQRINSIYPFLHNITSTCSCHGLVIDWTLPLSTSISIAVLTEFQINAELLISKIAQKEKFRTSFFSGSPHILKKTGLSKYFDTFDDSAALTQRNYYKDFKLQTNDFFEWYNEDPQPFFSIIYNSELEFSNSAEGNSLREIR
jgi:hypothetical protein